MLGLRCSAVATLRGARRIGWLPEALAVTLIGGCVAGEAVLLQVGIDDLDEGYFLQQAVRVLHGQVPYRDFETLYTPGLVSLHALILWALGGPYLLGPRALALLARAALALSLLGLTWPLVRQRAWAAAPGLFLLLAFDDAPVRWEPHPGWLSTLFAVLATWCVAHRPTRPWLVGAGAAAALAYLFKQNTGVFILAAIVVWSIAGGWSGQWLPFAAFATVTALWLVPLVVNLHGQVWLLAGFVGAVNQAGLSAPAEPSLAISLACLAGGVWLLRQQHADPRLRWYLLAGVALLCAQYPRMDTLHLAWSAPVLLVVGAVALDRARPRGASLVILVAAFGLTGSVLVDRLEPLGQHRVALSDLRFASTVEVPDRTASDLQGVLAEIQRRTGPGEPIFVYPTAPLLYAMAERPNPTRFDHLNPGAASPNQILGVIADLQAAHVRLVVISDYWRAVWGPPGPNLPLERWLESQYTELGRYGAYRVLGADL